MPKSSKEEQMPNPSNNSRTVPSAARVLGALQADEALLPGHAAALRRSGAVFLAFLVLGAVPFFLAANAVGLIGDVPAAVAKGSSSGPGGGDDDDSSGPGGGGDDNDDTGTHTRTGAAGATDDTSRNGHSTRGTTNDNDTGTRLGTDDTSRNGNSTRGTTNDNDTHTGTGTHTRTGGTQTRTRGQTRTGS
jgi:hypothetical protein